MLRCMLRCGHSPAGSDPQQEAPSRLCQGPGKNKDKDEGKDKDKGEDEEEKRHKRDELAPSCGRGLETPRREQGGTTLPAGDVLLLQQRR